MRNPPCTVELISVAVWVDVLATAERAWCTAVHNGDTTVRLYEPTNDIGSLARLVYRLRVRHDASPLTDILIW